MKKIIALLLMIFSGLKIAQAQQGFDIRDSIFLGQICHYSVEFPDGYLLCYGMPGEFTYPYTENLFLLSKDGSRVEEINFLTSNTQRILHITKWKNSQEWLFDMETKDTQTGKFERCLNIVNEAFEIISKHCFETDDFSDGFAHNFIDGKYVFIYNVGHLANRIIKVGRFDGINEIEFFSTSNSNFIFPSSIINSTNIDKYLLYTSTGVLSLNKTIDSFKIHPSLELDIHGSLQKLSKDRVAAYGVNRRLISEGEFEGFYYDNIIKLFNHNFEIIAADTTGIFPDSSEDISFNYPAYVQSLDFNGDYLFSAANIQMGIPIFETTKPKKFHVIKHDTLLNRQWRVILGGDTNTMVYGLFATEDGGCLVYGLRKAHGDDPQNYPYVVKLNADGVITSATPEPGIPEPAITLYGNPSQYLKFYLQDLPDWRGKLFIYDLSGKMQASADIDSGMIEIDTENWIPGMYLIQICDPNNNLIHSTKWIKQ